MADPADEAAVVNDRHQLKAEERVRKAAARIPVGEAGECDLCGEYFARTVNGICARCRDKRKLP